MIGLPRPQHGKGSCNDTLHPEILANEKFGALACVPNRSDTSTLSTVDFRNDKIFEK